MRTFSDWRDLPPIPRVGVKKNTVKLSQSNQFTASPCTISDSSSLGRRTSSEYDLDTLNSDTDDDIFVHRKRARHGASQHFSNNHPATRPSFDHTVTETTVPIQSQKSKQLTASPVSEGNTTLGDTDAESSDEEAVLRVIRRRRRHVGTSNSPSQQRRSPSKNLQSGRRDCTSSSDYTDRQQRSPRESKKRLMPSPPLQSATESKKRRRISSPVREFKEDRNVLKRHRRTEEAVSKRRNDFEEPLLLKTSPVSECDRGQHRSSGGGSRRRRCARQSTGSVTVPWYLMDEERRPRKLRSFSRSCAARCVYWTRTERRLFYIDMSPIHNRGLYASDDIPAFVPVIEYAGEVITQVQSEIREWAYQTRHMEEVYMYQLRKGTTNVIDGTNRGGPAKFANHSCEPNVIAEEIQAGGTNRVWFFSLRPIRKHEEILVDYGLAYEPGDVKRPCKCGARRCKKFLNYYGLTE